MKTIHYFTAILATSLLLTGCDTNDDGFYNEKYVTVPNLIQVEGQDVYLVGEHLYVTADFSRYLDEQNEPLPLDIYRTTSGAAAFNFSYVLERRISANVWEYVNIDQADLDIITGTAQSGSFVLASAVYDAGDETYEYNVGIPLLATGDYRLSFGYNSASPTEVELRSKTTGNNLFLNLVSSVNDLNPNGFYTFTVN